MAYEKSLIFTAGLLLGVATRFLIPSHPPAPGAAGQTQELSAAEKRERQSKKSAAPATSGSPSKVVPSVAEGRLEDILKIAIAEKRFDALAALGHRLGKMGDLEVLRRALAGITAPDDSASFIQGAIDGLSSNPKVGWEFAKNLKESPFKNLALTHALTNLAATDPQMALTEAAANLQGQNYQGALVSIAETWARSQPEAAIEWGAKQDAAVRQTALDIAVSEWGKTAPDKALQYVLSHQLGGSVVGAVMGTWAQHAPVPAFEAAQRYAQDTGDTNPLRVALLNWANYDPQAASVRLAGLNDPALNSEIGIEISTQWAQSDPQGALNYARTLSDPTAAQDATMAAVQVWAGFDAGGALNHVAAWDGANPLRSEALDDIVGSLASQSEAVFGVYLRQLPPGLQTEMRQRYDAIVQGSQTAAPDISGTVTPRK